jgi:hypothetical protein
MTSEGGVFSGQDVLATPLSQWLIQVSVRTRISKARADAAAWVPA